ncbi:hypothetical protein F5Y07DRAFT_410239 [Xylaria sp. FL0933]|nr:hypothetical protein F5Y07DRAFT_410239 [Xylaria sp. FL0933]
MSKIMNPAKEIKKPLPLSEVKVTSQPIQFNTVDSAVSLSFPENMETDLPIFENLKKVPNMETVKVNNVMPNNDVDVPTETSGIVEGSNAFTLVNGMPYRYSKLVEMGEALAKARRERMFPVTITPAYNIKATIDDYEDLERLSAAREGAADTRDDAFHPDVAGLYIKIQRRIQDRDLTHGEVAADSNVRARLSGFANSTGAETGMYNLMRHAMNSVLRLNNLSIDSESNVINVTNRVLSEIRATVQSQAARGAHGVNGVNMDGVMETVFNAIEISLGNRVESQADLLAANATRFDANVTRADHQINAIAGHVNAIDNHVHAMGNNVNAMGTLLNSTNGNVTSLTANITVLQTLLNMLPQMVTNSVQEMLPDVLGPAISIATATAFEAAITNELLNRMQAFANTVGETGTSDDAKGRPPSYRSHKRRSWFGKLNVFRKRRGHHGRRANVTA